MPKKVADGPLREAQSSPHSLQKWFGSILLPVVESALRFSGAFVGLGRGDPFNGVELACSVDGRVTERHEASSLEETFGIDAEVARAFKSKRVLHASELWGVERRYPVPSVCRHAPGDGFADALVMPLRGEGAFYGVFGVERRTSEAPFCERDQRALAKVAPYLEAIVQARCVMHDSIREAAARAAIGHPRGIFVVDCRRRRIQWRGSSCREAGGLEQHEQEILDWVQQNVDARSNDASLPLPLRLSRAKVVSVAPLEDAALFGNGQDGQYVAVEVVFGEQPKDTLAILSGREQQIARLLAAGYTHINIGALCGLSSHTVRTYIRRMYTKLGICTRADLVREVVGQE